MHQARVLCALDSQNAAHSARGLCMAFGFKKERRMKLIFVALTVIAWSASVAADGLQSFGAAKKIWDQTSDRNEYRTYQNEFIQYNNSLKLDEKDGCYALSKETVELMLVITRQDGAQFAVVEKVFSNVDSAKAQCFKKSYLGLRTKVPPFLPFVLQMGMG